MLNSTSWYSGSRSMQNHAWAPESMKHTKYEVKSLESTYPIARWPSNM